MRLVSGQVIVNNISLLQPVFRIRIQGCFGSESGFQIRIQVLKNDHYEYDDYDYGFELWFCGLLLFSLQFQANFLVGEKNLPGSGLRFLAGSGFNENGSETLHNFA